MSTPLRHHFARSLILTGILFGGAVSAQTLPYPPARKGDVVDDYHGTRVADPYRWLEDPDSPESRGWIDAENRLTEGYLSQIPERAALRKRLTALWNYPKYGAPFQDRKSTRLNSSHRTISYAVFCLKKKKNKNYAADQAHNVI